VTRWREHVEALVLRADRRLLEHSTDLLGHRLVLRGPGSRPVENPDYDDAWLTFLIRRSTTFVDLGCSAGAFSVLAALDPDRIVVAVDANTRALQWCADNLIANGLADRAHFVLAFLAPEDGGTWAPEAQLVDPGFAPHAHLPVPRRSLDAIVAQLDLHPDLVKVDVEGGEGDVLDGATATATAFGPAFHVEMHATPSLTMVGNARRILAWCDRTAYDAHYLAEHRPLTDADQIVDRGRCHLLLLPRATPYPAGLSQLRQGDPIDRVVDTSPTP